MLSQRPWRSEAVMQFITALGACFCLGAVASGLLQKFGVNGFKQPEDFGNVLLLAVALMGLIAAPAVWWWQEISVSMFKSLGWPVEDQAAVIMIKGAKAWGEYAYLSFFAVVLAPVAEEFIFRGVLFSFVKQLGSPRWAFFGISALFAEIHFDAGTLVPLFVLALVLTWLYEKTGNLLAPIAAHSLFNAANLVVLHFASE